ncbi:MAG: type I restriction enzyme HsdR N-terminal domain-containing protein [Flavobacteriales bacterium]
MADAGTPSLALPDHGVKTRHGPDGAQVFDPIRRQWVALLPEEWVRQHFINFLVHDRGCPASLIAVERRLTLNGLCKRADIVVHAADGRAVALAECKAPTVRLGPSAFEQAARYNLVLGVPWLLVTNGLRHYCFRVDHAAGTVKAMVEIPGHASMCAA